MWDNVIHIRPLGRYLPFTILLLFIVLTLKVLSDIATSPIRYIFAFGDSYTTTFFDPNGAQPAPLPGNPLGNPAYPGLTTDNGPNWLDVVVYNVSPSNTLAYNYARGSATVFRPTLTQTLVQQVADWVGSVGSQFSDVAWRTKETAAVVWIGVNDLYTLDPPSNSSLVYQQDADAYFAQLGALHNAGVNRFLLITVPPIDRTPFIVAFGPEAANVTAHQISIYNTMIISHAAKFTANNSGSTLSILDSAPIFNQILDNPCQHGAPNETCWNNDGVSCLWWNNYHPGQVIQKAVGHAVYELLSAAGFYNGIKVTVPSIETLLQNGTVKSCEDVAAFTQAPAPTSAASSASSCLWDLISWTSAGLGVLFYLLS